MMYEQSKAAFTNLLEEMRPERVIVPGLDAWKNMPLDTDRFLCRDVQSYRLKLGAQAWCLALPHPANRQEGFSWVLAHESINLFRQIEFPRSAAA